MLYNGSATVPTDAGTYAVIADFTPTYTATYETLTDESAGNFVIDKADADCNIVGYTGEYDGLFHGATGACLDLDDEELGGLDLGDEFKDVPGGTANWTFTDGTGNYNDDFGSVEIEITPKELTVTPDPDDAFIYFGQTPPTFEPSYDGFVDGEDEDDLTTPPTCDIVGDFTGAVGIYDVDCEGGEATNYTFTFVPGSFEVKAWTATGFYRPVHPDEDVINSVRRGSTVPLKFNVYQDEDKTNEFTDTLVVTSLSYVYIGADASGDDQPVDQLATGGTVLRYDTVEKQFVFNWQTPRVTGLFRATVTFQDGSSLSAIFKLK